MNEYSASVQTLIEVVQRGRSLDNSWHPEASPLAREITYGVLRQYQSLQSIVSQLVKKPLATKHADIQLLLLAGIYSIDALHRPEYSSVNAAVSSAAELGKGWARGMVNGVLRNYIRKRETLRRDLTSNEETRFNHPAWLISAIRAAWPTEAEEILGANNEKAPLTLRVNRLRQSRETCLAALAEAGIEARPGEWSDTAIYLDRPLAAEQLPGFREGAVSIQDEASQLVASVVDPAPGERVLDACAAPGGKTCHLLETCPDMTLVALDISGERAALIESNLERLELAAQVVVTDLTTYADGTFDRILLDAPCSATGIIRRHPDIKLLRRHSDIDKLAGAQLKLLSAVWQMLKPGGTVIYSTCSILPQENDSVVAAFMKSEPAATLVPIDAPWGVATRYGRQLLPARGAHDGFYYSRLVKPA